MYCTYNDHFRCCLHWCGYSPDCCMLQGRQGACEVFLQNPGQMPYAMHVFWSQVPIGGSHCDDTLGSGASSPFALSMGSTSTCSSASAASLSVLLACGSVSVPTASVISCVSVGCCKIRSDNCARQHTGAGMSRQGQASLTD
jgi:hypothetical protein